MFDLAKEMYFKEKTPVNKSLRDRPLIGLLKSSGVSIFASGVSSFHKTRFLSSHLNQLCDRIKILLQKEEAGNVCDKNNEEIVAIVDKMVRIQMYI